MKQEGGCFDADLHAHLDDVVLDYIAAATGDRSGIGRLSLVDDALLLEGLGRVPIARCRSVLDLGAGRGFLGRVLQSYGWSDICYTAIERSASAALAIQHHLPSAHVILGDYRDERWPAADLVTFIDSWIGTDDDDAILERCKGIGNGVTIMVGIGSTRINDIVNRRSALLREIAADVAILRGSRDHNESALRRCAMLVSQERLHPVARERLAPQAGAIMRSILAGSYGYAILIAVRARR